MRARKPNESGTWAVVSRVSGSTTSIDPSTNRGIHSAWGEAALAGTYSTSQLNAPRTFASTGRTHGQDHDRRYGSRHRATP